MDKLMEEEDLKGLEEEIDDAVNRLFVEKKRDREEILMESPLVDTPSKPSVSEPSMTPPVPESPLKPHPFEPSVESPMFEPSVMESLLAEPPLKPSAAEPSMRPPVLESPVKPHSFERSVTSPILEPSYEFEKSLGEERAPHPPSAPSPAPVPVPFLKSIEKMEAQLLSLEWEITGEKLEKAREEILALKELLKQKADMTSILSWMENVLNRMIKNEEDIRPPLLKFLLDSKETIKLLMRKETGGEINIYKQLAYLGIEARFSCLEGLKDTKINQPSSKEVPGLSIAGEKQIGEMTKGVHSFMKRVEEIFGTIQQQIVQLEETSRKLSAPSVETRSPAIPAINVTIFKIDERLFGVESERVFKLFKVPKTFEEKYSDQQNIRLRNFEVKMIDLKKLLAIQEGGPKEQIRILTVKEDGEYKGFMVDEVLKRVSILSDRTGEAGGYFSGVIHSTYEEQAVEIPILDLKKF
ncbi:MAG: chemotaxis protein CheW [Thermodesulfobacteriota bacterium]